AGLGVEGLDESAHAELAAGDPDHHLALNGQWGDGHVVAGAPVPDSALPGHLAGPGVERHEHAIERREEDLAAVKRDASFPALDWLVAGPSPVRRRRHYSSAPNPVLTALSKRMLSPYGASSPRRGSWDETGRAPRLLFEPHAPGEPSGDNWGTVLNRQRKH